MGRKRDLLRVQRLLRRVDMEEVLEDLGIEVMWVNGCDAYCMCPDPDHYDENPSFHICIQDVEDKYGNSKLGWWNCWSHPDENSMRGFNFMDLVAKIRFDLWGYREDEKLNWPTEKQRSSAASWLRKEYLKGGSEESIVRVERSMKTRIKAIKDWRELLLPPVHNIQDSDDEYIEYLERREITLERAIELRVKSVRSPGDQLRSVLRRTIPGVLFPIVWDGKDVNWYVRGINKRLASNAKGRYCPGLPLGKGAGILWAPDGIEPKTPVILVEGIFDAERVRGIVIRNELNFNIVAVLGGRLYSEQAKHLRTAEYVIHLADGDAGGKTLSESIKDKLGKFTKVLIRPLPDGEDPGDAEEDLILELLDKPVAVPKVRVRFKTAIRS
jgi:hypothetical protein